jgi:hypothetical protein
MGSIKTAIKSRTVDTSGERLFTADDMIDAWANGCSGGNRAISDSMAITMKMLRTASNVANGFYNDMLVKNNCNSLFMQVTPGRVYFIAGLPWDIYFDDDKSRPIYNEASHIARKHPSVCFTFIPCKEGAPVNYDALQSDGYVQVI